MPHRCSPLIVVLLFLAGPSLVRFYTDWLWFGEVGYQQVFATMLRTQGTLFTIVFVVAVVLADCSTCGSALASIGDVRPVFTTREGLEVTLPGGGSCGRSPPARPPLLARAHRPLTPPASGRSWLAWRNAVPFGQADPILGRDVGFYVFSLPFLQFVRGLGQALVVLAALGVAARCTCCPAA